MDRENSNFSHAYHNLYFYRSIVGNPYILVLPVVKACLCGRYSPIRRRCNLRCIYTYENVYIRHLEPRTAERGHISCMHVCVYLVGGLKVHYYFWLCVCVYVCVDNGSTLSVVNGKRPLG